MLSDLGINLLASLIWFIVGMVATIASLRFAGIRRMLRKIGISIPVSRPQLDLDLEYDRQNNSTSVVIKNAGDRVAYNVGVFLFELYMATDTKNYTITSLGGQKIRAGVLARNEKMTFLGKKVNFEGCSVTVEQEMWVEYTDEDGVHYRTKIIPPSPRGDDLKVMPPIRIDKRMPALPTLKYEGVGNVEAIRSGKEGIPGLSYL